MADTKTDAGVRCVIVTPETTILDARARFVTLPLCDGLRGVARGHAPFIGRLGVGAVRIVGEQGGPADRTREVFVEGGFVEVGHDAVTVITQRALHAEKIDADQARTELATAQASKAVGDDAIAARFKAIEAARALARTAGR
jgi:F-type H+-transporting ATPase subunit epsilon